MLVKFFVLGHNENCPNADAINGLIEDMQGIQCQHFVIQVFDVNKYEDEVAEKKIFLESGKFKIKFQPL